MVEDEGGGVPEELRERLFERFARGGEDGSGLGLAIARAHGGAIVYEPGRPGASFRVVIPAPPVA